MNLVVTAEAVGDPCPHPNLLLWGRCSLVCSCLGLHSNHTADGDPYCHGHTGGDAICEMMPLMSAFLSRVGRLLPST